MRPRLRDALRVVIGSSAVALFLIAALWAADLLEVTR
jgi:hypothetical protein